MKSLGVIETRGLVTAIQAVDAACKAAGVTCIGYRKIGSGLVSVCFEGGSAPSTPPLSAASRSRRCPAGQIAGHRLVRNPASTWRRWSHPERPPAGAKPVANHADMKTGPENAPPLRWKKSAADAAFRQRRGAGR